MTATDQPLRILALAGPAGLFRGLIEGPLLALHPAVPGDKGLGLYDGGDLGEPVFNPHAVSHKDAAVRLAQRDSVLKLGAENAVLRSEVINLLGEILLEELLDLDEERICAIFSVDSHNRRLRAYRTEGKARKFLAVPKSGAFRRVRELTYGFLHLTSSGIRYDLPSPVVLSPSGKIGCHKYDGHLSQSVLLAVPGPGRMPLLNNGSTAVVAEKSNGWMLEEGDIHFLTTHWTLVCAARNPSRAACAEALESRCRIYWYPLYAYVRRRGYSADDAQDLTQAFFRQLLSKDSLRAADPDKGRSRTFLLTAMKRFLAKEWRRAGAQKRGGRCLHVPIDQAWAEETYCHEPVDDVSPDVFYERRWALVLLGRAMDAVGHEMTPAGREGRFEAVKDTLTGCSPAGSYAQIADALGLSESAVKAAAYRMRERYRHHLRAFIRETVNTASEVDAEIQYLLIGVRVNSAAQAISSRRLQPTARALRSARPMPAVMDRRNGHG